MKKLLLIFAILSAGYEVVTAQPAAVQRLWSNANAAYAQADYKQAITYYDSIQMLGYTGHDLYYNLGNAYFRDGKIGQSILNYERALDLRPADDDARHNLSVANSYVKDKIDNVPEFFLVTWVRSLRMSLSSNAWAAISLILFAITLSAVLLYLLSGRLAIRKTGFYTGIIALLLFLLSLSFSSAERRQILYPEYAIVMHSSASVKSSPDNGSKELFIIHEGTKVKVVREIGQWKEIMIADGNKGWMNSDAIEMI